MKTHLLIAALVICAPALSQKNAQSDLDKKIAEFDAYTQLALKQWDVVGAAVVVVKDGKVIYKKGFGVRELGTNNAVNTETQFACASTTKAMTAVCLGMLVDEGKVRWDDPISKHLPGFLLYDPFVTRDLKVRDLLVHDSGVGNTDFLWDMMEISDNEVLERMRLVKPVYSPRAGFIYQNIFYVAAGKVIEKVSGQTWDDFIRDRIFKPLGMSRTFTKMRMLPDANYTKPHYKVEGKIQPIGYNKDEAIGPAGSVWSSIDDMSTWVRVMLDSSKYSGGKLLKSTTWMEMFKPQVIAPSGFYPTTRLTKPNWTTYGFGWFQQDYKGHKANYHTGSLSGLVALHAQLPDQSLGYYFFGNYDHAEVRHALMFKAFDVFALGGTRDWSTEFLTLYTGIRESQEREVAKMEAQRVPNTKPSLPLSAYAGKYTDPLYGVVEVTATETGLRVDINKMEAGTLEHWNFDTFYGKWDKKWYGKLRGQFTLTPTGKVDKVNLGGMELKKTE